MVDKPLPTDIAPAGTEAHPSAAQPPRGAGGRGPEARDSVAELAERAQIISQEAGSKVAAAMKDVISAAAGIAGFAIESARDLVQYMVRRGQMTQDEADKLIRQAEEAHDRRPASEKGRPTATKVAADRAAAAKAEAAARAASLAVTPAPHGAHSGHHAHVEQHARATAPATRPASVPAAAKPPVVAKPPAAKTTKSAAPVKAAKNAGADKANAKAAAKSTSKPETRTARATRPTAKSNSKPGANSAAKKAVPKKKR